MRFAQTILYIVDLSPVEGGRLNDELRYSAEIKKIKNLDTASNLTDEEKRLRLEGVCDASSPADEDDRGTLFSTSKREESSVQEMEVYRVASPCSYRHRGVLARTY